MTWPEVIDNAVTAVFLIAAIWLCLHYYVKSKIAQNFPLTRDGMQKKKHNSTKDEQLNE